MSIYKFRVAYEDDENIYRDIEILPNQTMKDLDDTIVDAFKLPKDRTCHLYFSNDRQQKIKEIDLNPQPVKKGKDFVTLMILNYVDDPHQKFLYEFETAKQGFSLLIELVSIIGTEKPGTKYPSISKSVGPSPVKKDELIKHLTKNSFAEEEQFGIEKGEEDDLEGMGEEGEVLETKDEEGADDVEGESFESEFGFDETGDFKE